MSDLPGVALVIAAVGVFVTTITAAIASLVTLRRAGRIQHEVKTWNELTIGQYTEATETRRISNIPLDDRTPREDRHMAGDVLRDEET